MELTDDGATGYLKLGGVDALKFNKYGLTTNPVTTRQTVENGTVDANGFSAFGGSTGSTTVTAASALYVTAANGMENRRGYILNPQWNNLAAFGDGVRPLYLDINPDGSCVTASAATLPVYQWGGTYSTTNGQFTFNIQEMTGKVGNGTVATQTYRVAVGEVVVSGGLVASIVWYALMGRYMSPNTAIANSTAYSFNHNIGCSLITNRLELINVTAEYGYTTGQAAVPVSYYDGTSNRGAAAFTKSPTSSGTVSSSNVAVLNAISGVVQSAITAAFWNQRLTCRRIF